MCQHISHMVLLKPLAFSIDELFFYLYFNILSELYYILAVL